jgi:PAS domain S-box-containing protein
MALFGNTTNVVARIGTGAEYAPILRKLQLDNSIEQPLVVRDSCVDLPPGTDTEGIRFAASAPLRTSSGICLGALVIADRVPRPHFSGKDAHTLGDLASVLAGKMELRMIASLALESELSLRETERRFRGIANCAPVLLFYSRPDGECLFVNKTWLDFSGRKLEEELETGWADLIHPNHREQVMDEYWRALQERRPFATEAPFRRHDGEYRWLAGQGAPRFREDATFAGYVGCLWDITAHHNSLAAARKQAQLTTAVAEVARVFYLVLDPQGRIEEVSPTGHNLAPPSSQPMVGGLVWEVLNAAIPGALAIRDALRQAVTGRAAVQTQTFYTDPAGETVELTWTLTPMTLESGELSSVVATVFETRGGTVCGTVRCPCGRMCPSSL